MMQITKRDVKFNDLNVNSQFKMLMHDRKTKENLHSYESAKLIFNTEISTIYKICISFIGLYDVKRC